MSNFTHTIIGIDISKSSTGICVLRREGYRVHFEKLDSIQIKGSGYFTKYHFLAKDLIIQTLFDLIKPYLGDEGLSISVELPVYGESASELQYLLFQEVINLFYRLNVDVVGYSNGTVKSFAKHCTPNPKAYKGSVDKSIMKQIYTEFVASKNDWLPSEARNDDEIDALFLALMGVVFHSNYLLEYFNPNMEWNLIGNSSLLLNRFILGSGLYKFDNLVLGDLDFSVQFKTPIKNAIKNGHLSLGYSGCYFFKYFNLVREYFLNGYKDGGDAFIKDWAKRLGTTGHHLKNKLDSDNFLVLLNKQGSLVLYSSMYNKLSGGF